MRLLALLALTLLATPAHAGVMFQGFYWDAPSQWDSPWWDKLAGKASEIAEAGFTSVWIPPVLKGAAGGFSNGYDPFDDYDIGSKDQCSTYATHWGTREQLLRAVAMLRANGMEVYVDNVLGHRNGDDGYAHFRYKGAFGQENGGRFEKWPDHFTGVSSGFGRQINYFHYGVKNQLIEAGDWMMNTLGVQGMRIDLATKVDPAFLRDYLNSGAMGGKFTVAEYWSENVDELDHYVNRMGGRVSVFDFPLWGLLKDMSNNKGFFDMRRLQRAGYAARAPQLSVTFVENHDTDRGYPTSGNKHLGYAYILTSEGYPSVFWKDYYEYGMKRIIDPLVWIHEKLADGSTEYRWADEDLLVYERRGKRGLLVGLNDNASSGRSEWVSTAFSGNVQLHDYTGNGPDIWTAGDGRVQISVPANSYVAYAPAGMSEGFWVGTHEVQQQVAGVRDLDVKPALPGDWSGAQRIWVQAGTTIKANLYWRDGLHADSRIQIAIAPDGGSPGTIIDREGRYNDGWGEYRANSTGWYTVSSRVQAANKDQGEVSYWLNLRYQAPKRF
jgi:alpha-amylase